MEQYNKTETTNGIKICIKQEKTCWFISTLPNVPIRTFHASIPRQKAFLYVCHDHIIRVCENLSRCVDHIVLDNYKLTSEKESDFHATSSKFEFSIIHKYQNVFINFYLIIQIKRANDRSQQAGKLRRFPKIVFSAKANN